MTDAPYELFYWPRLPGRGEYPRLMLEDAGARYVDVARLPESEGGGVPAVRALLSEQPAVFAVPALRHGSLVISQTANICLYLGPRLDLAPADEAGRLHCNQLQLTLMDLAAEAHDVHHPISTAKYYEEQRSEAKLAAVQFVTHRLPKFLAYFESALEGAGPYLLGEQVYYPDLSLFHSLLALEYAFPRAYSGLAPEHPRLGVLRERIAERPRLAAYLASVRRVPFNEHGVFRHYAELDVLPER